MFPSSVSFNRIRKALASGDLNASGVSLDGYATKEDLKGVAPTSEAIAKAMGVWIVADAVEPPKAMYGVPVLWVNTGAAAAGTNKSSWVPKAPTFDIASKTYTIPTDTGVDYLVDNAVKTAGTYNVTAPTTVRITARAKSGYTLAGTTEWSQVFEERVSAYEVAALAMKPEHYWRFDEASGIPLDRGTSPVRLMSGGGAIYSDEGIGVGATSIGAQPTKMSFMLGSHLPTGTAAYTMAAVVKGSGTPFQDWSQKNRLGIYSQTSKLINAGPTTGWATQTSIDLAQINHIAATWDGSTLKTYLNGIEVSSVADAGPVTQTNALAIGRADEFGLKMAGVILDTKRAFSAEEIKKLSDAVVR